MGEASQEILKKRITKEDALGLAKELILANPVLISKICKGAGVSEEEVQPLLVEVFCFLYLISWSGQRLTPSEKVDLAWHEFILCTKAYHDFCDEKFGRFIHHHPGGESKSIGKQFQQTIKLYLIYFGEPPTKFWGNLANKEWEAAQCGSCESHLG